MAGDRLDDARREAQSSNSTGGSGILGALAGLSEAVAADDDDDRPRHAQPSTAPAVQVAQRGVGFLAYPYVDGRRGFAVHTQPGDDLPPWGREYAFRFSAEGAYLYDDVWRSGSSITLMAPKLYARASYDLMLEGPTPKLEGDIEVQGAVRDRLHFAGVEVGPQVVHEQTFAARFGLVGTLMFDDQRSLPDEPTLLPGIGAALELELYPVRPLVFTARGALSRIGGAVAVQGRVTASVMIRRFEIYAGYDHRLIGRVPLGGPTLGVAARF